MARKTWDQLSEVYRQRLLRAGIGEKEHAQGTSLHKARGHKSKAQESRQQKYLRDTRKYAAQYARTYGKDEEELLAIFREMSPSEFWEVMNRQQEAEDLYDSGHETESHDVWVARNLSLDWEWYYHGAFR